VEAEASGQAMEAHTQVVELPEWVEPGVLGQWARMQVELPEWVEAGVSVQVVGVY